MTDRAPRSDAQILIRTGALVGSGCSLVLPVLWMVVWGLLGAVDAPTTATWVVISLIYAIPAALVFALVGAAAGSVTSMIWRSGIDGGRPGVKQQRPSSRACSWAPARAWRSPC